MNKEIVKAVSKKQFQLMKTIRIQGLGFLSQERMEAFILQQQTQ